MFLSAELSLVVGHTIQLFFPVLLAAAIVARNNLVWAGLTLLTIINLQAPEAAALLLRMRFVVRGNHFLDRMILR